jgi:hypothetical protein
MAFTRTIPVRFTDYHVNALQKISLEMHTDISSVVRLCVEDGIETFIRWSGKDVSGIQPDHDQDVPK